MVLEKLLLATRGWSNVALPALLYRDAVGVTGGERARRMEVLFRDHGWPPSWRNRVFRFHHYHSNAHEILGCAKGSARLILGGSDGRQVAVEAGDIAALPAGKGHFLIEADREFLVVGAYPPDQREYDLCRTDADAVLAPWMAALGFPPTDPVAGRGGPLPEIWADAVAPM
ncbi:MAG: cupin domain-containing protein [Acetobacteraceae bacterium]